MRRVVVILVLAVPATGTAVAVGLRSVPFTTIDHGGASSAFGKQPQGAIRDTATWRRVWRHYHGEELPRDRLPNVDFSRYTLIAVSAGTRPNGGYSLEVKRITDDGRRVRMTINVNAPGDNCVMPQVIIAPYAIVRVRRSSKPVVFFRKTTVYEC